MQVEMGVNVSGAVGSEISDVSVQLNRDNVSGAQLASHTEHAAFRAVRTF